MTENTFIIIKPDAIERGLSANIVKRFQKVGRIMWLIGLYKNRYWCKQHYAHIESNPELSEQYAIMEDFMVGKLLIGFCLRGENIIKRARELTGPTRVLAAPSGTIRCDYSNDTYNCRPICHNLVHAADSKDAVRREANLFLNRSIDYDFNV
jgi:nucleoside-diphosphate kinase